MQIETREHARIRAHYEIERQLAERLRAAEKPTRRDLYLTLYDELFRSVPDHPQLERRDDQALSAQEVRRKMALVARYLTPDTRFLEVGAGDCAFAAEAAARVREVIAVDVSATIAAPAGAPPNLTIVISDGTSIPVPEGSIDVAYSNQLMEHLHPDDAEEQLANIHRALAPGGAYVCITPNRLSGPHDVSKYFDRVATGLHLREYTYRELLRLFRRAGFTHFRAYCGGQGFYFRCPASVLAAAEALLDLLPWRLRAAVGRSLAGRAVLGVHLVALKRR